MDSDLVSLCGAAPRRLNEQVGWNIERFPSDFMFELNPAEVGFLRSRIATSKPGRGKHRKYLPHAFTEHGAD
ncbi:MAG: ORF6N domain-containing protein [Candidatus Zixiibacteriota bacterium]